MIYYNRGVDLLAEKRFAEAAAANAKALRLDPTNATVPDERYITTAWGRDYADVTPLKGVVYSSATDQVLTVAVDVIRLTPSWNRDERAKPTD